MKTSGTLRIFEGGRRKPSTRILGFLLGLIVRTFSDYG